LLAQSRRRSHVRQDARPRRGTLLGVTRNPQTFEVLEEFRAPFERTLLVLVRGAVSKVHAGDYAYMLGDAGTAEVLEAA
jgi:uncharacterized protein